MSVSVMFQSDTRRTLSIKSNSNFINGYAWAGMTQPGITLYMGEQLYLGYDLILNSGNGLPSGVRCDVQVKATEHDILSYVRYDSSSSNFVSFNTSTAASYNGTGTFSITAFCQGAPSGPWPNISLGFNNVRLLAAYDTSAAGAALSCGYREARDAIQSATLQPYCSSLLSYATPTTTITAVVSTTTTVTLGAATTAGRKRDVTPSLPVVFPPPSVALHRRQLIVNDNVTSSSTTGNSFGSTPTALVTFAPIDITNACSAEASAVSTTVSTTTYTTTTVTQTANSCPLATNFCFNIVGHGPYIEGKILGMQQGYSSPSFDYPTPGIFYIGDQTGYLYDTSRGWPFTEIGSANTWLAFYPLAYSASYNKPVCQIDPGSKALTCVDAAYGINSFSIWNDQEDSRGGTPLFGSKYPLALFFTSYDNLADVHSLLFSYIQLCAHDHELC